MLKLKKLRFKAIGRFVDWQEVDVDSLGNLSQVDGDNRNTGGSSGSGKTTAFNALDYLLGLNDLPLTVLQSRLTKESIEVIGEFDCDGRPLLLSRGKKGLSIDLDGELTEGSSKLSEEKLDQIIGMSRDLFRKILHKRQKEGGFFLKLTPKEMYQFLTDCLGLGEIRKKLEIVENQLKNLEKGKENAQNSLNQANSAILATRESILSLGLAPVRDIHQETILALKSKFDTSNSALMTLIQEHKDQTLLLDSQRPQLIPNPELEPLPELERPTLLDTTYPNSSTISLMEAKVFSINTQINDLKEKENFRIKQLSSQIQEKKLSISALKHAVSLAITAKAEATKIALEIKKIRESICPTCEQSWVTETAKSKESEKLTQLTQYKNQIQEGSQAESNISKLESEISILSEQNVSNIDIELSTLLSSLEFVNQEIIKEKLIAETFRKESAAKNDALLADFREKEKIANSAVTLRNQTLLASTQSKNKALQDDYQAKMAAVRATHSKDLEQARGQTEVDRMALDSAVNKLKSFEEARVRYETAMSSMKNKENEYLESEKVAQTSLVKAETDIVLAEELKKALKMFLSCSFDDALEAIGDAATKIIRCIPTMVTATIQFESQKETKDGKIKEEVTPVISVDGEPSVPIKSLSGGEQSAVDLAVDLAVIDFIETETGKGIDVFILDEPFSGFDTIGIEMALEVLKNSNQNKKLIIVDHNDIIKQMVGNRLVVVRDGLISNITQEVVSG